MADWSQEQYIKAYRFAAKAHHGQTITGSNLPYVMHVTLVCMEVIATFRVETGLNEDLAAQCALLHDTLEDTATTYLQLESEFGTPVANGVLALSKDPAVAKHLQLEDSLRRIRLQPREIWMVKLADRITNLQPPPVRWSKQKIASYRQEATQIHESLKAASPALSGRLLAKIEAYNAHL
jgi:(p)ppGpp synthase/HD superfamily hydrolase